MDRGLTVIRSLKTLIRVTALAAALPVVAVATQAVATQAGIGQLTEEHFTVLNFARASFIEKGKSPNVRALATGSGVGTKVIYTLFPKKPGPTIARVAGIPKPVGCI